MVPDSPPLPELVLYTRDGCHLCEEARAAIARVLEERTRAGLPRPVVREVDIAADRTLEAAYRERIPVVELGDARIELMVGARRLARLLSRVLDGRAA